MIAIPLILYNLIFPILFVLYLPFYITRLIKRGGVTEDFWERFGIFSALKKKQLNDIRNPIWVHAVSVGETIAALSLIRSWIELEPDLQFVLSTTTTTGQKIARDQSPENVTAIYCPVDYFVCILSAIKTVKPQMLIIFEVEIWPNLIVLASLKKIKLALVNCRMSDKSARGYARHRWFFHYIFSRFSLISAQMEEDASRIKTITGDLPYIKVCNTMKFDQIPDTHSNNKIYPIIDHVFPDKGRVVFTAASTHKGEEAIMIRVFKSLATDFPSLNLILAPRHKERTREVEKILQGANLGYKLLTELTKGLKNGKDCAIEKENVLGGRNKKVLLVNTTGDLMSLFAVSDIVFVGKSLGCNKGGHNIIEPAIFGKPIIYGKNMDNFRKVARIFKDNRAAIEVEDEQGFSRALHDLLSNPAKRERLGKVSRETVEANRGAIRETINLLRNI